MPCAELACDGRNALWFKYSEIFKYLNITFIIAIVISEKKIDQNQ